MRAPTRIADLDALKKDKARDPVYSTSWERQGPSDRRGLPSALSSTQLLVWVNASMSAHIRKIWWRRLTSGADSSSPKPQLSRFNSLAGTVLLWTSVFFADTLSRLILPDYLPYLPIPGRDLDLLILLILPLLLSSTEISEIASAISVVFIATLPNETTDTI